MAAPKPHFSIAPATADESAGVIEFTITKTGNSGKSSTLKFETIPATALEGVDYVRRIQTITFGSKQQSKVVAVKVLVDQTEEATKVFVARITATTNAIVDTATAVGTITDAFVEPLPTPDPTPAPIPAPAPAPTPTPTPTTLIATQSNVVAQFAALQDGWVLQLEGPIVGWAPQDRAFGTRVTVDCTNAQVSDLYARRLNNVRFTGGTHTAITTYAFRFDSCANIRVDTVSLSGASLGTQYGIFVNVGTDFEIATVSLTGGLRSGIVMGQVTGLDVRAITARAMGSDCLDLYGVREFYVDGIDARDFTPTVGAHPDVVQMASAAGGLKTGNGIIRNVVAVGATQGVNLFNHAETGQLGGENIIVELCDLYLSYGQAIAINDVTNLTVRDNRVRSYPGNLNQASINIQYNTNVARNRNIVEGYTTAAGRVYAPIIDPDYVG